MKIIEHIEEYFVRRNLRRRLIKITNCEFRDAQFRKVLNTLRENRVMVESRPDGIWMRLAGSGDNMINVDHFIKVVDFRNIKLEDLGV